MYIHWIGLHDLQDKLGYEKAKVMLHTIARQEGVYKKRRNGFINQNHKRYSKAIRQMTYIELNSAIAVYEDKVQYGAKRWQEIAQEYLDVLKEMRDGFTSRKNQ